MKNSNNSIGLISVVRLYCAKFRKQTKAGTAYESLPLDGYSLDCATVEKDDSLQFLVVEEVVEAPQRSGLSEWIRVQVRIVAVNVAIGELDLIVNGSPQSVLQLSV